jgi:hypothetical protein
MLGGLFRPTDPNKGWKNLEKSGKSTTCAGSTASRAHLNF